MLRGGVANRGPAPVGSTDAGTLTAIFRDSPSSVAGTVLTDLRSIPGVQTATVLRKNLAAATGSDTAVIACADLPAAYGRCAAGTTIAAVPMSLIPFRGSASSTTVWPSASVPPGDLQRLPVASIVVGTDGSAAAVERSRTLLEVAYPTAFWVAPNVPGDFESDFADTLRGWQQLANVIIIASLALGCSLAVSAVGGLSERKRPFSLLRLSRAPLRVLRRVVVLETAVPMLAVVAVGIGFLAAQLFLKAQMDYTLTGPGLGFFATVVVGLAACLGIIASTLPLLQRITGPKTAHSE